MSELYEPFVRNGNPILVMDERSAEMTKYAANSFLATKISFINEIANLCERLGANIDCVRRGMGSDSRIGKHFLYAGIGYGGSCFPKDVKALAKTAKEHGQPLKVLSAVMAANEEQRAVLLPHILGYFGGSLEGKQLAVWGLSFKANTDDVRESSALALIGCLLDLGGKVRAYDPVAMGTARAVIGEAISYAPNAYGALLESDALIFCTEWNEFRRPDFEEIKQHLKQPAVFDGRNLYDPQQMAKLGFDYFSIGRPSPTRVIENDLEETNR
ncbi:MAG TPA: nucleotide sugar dehydrogenase [Chroococcales cyanobacterium]|jgi:UDPglucose 6-dehydrogenase